MADIFNIASIQKKIQEIENNANQKVCVVGVVGRGHLNQKDNATNQLVDHQAFQTNQQDFFGKPKKNLEEIQVAVKIFYDEEQKTVFLQLSSVYDAALLVETCKAMHQNLTLTGRHHYWQDQLLKHAAALLFIFSVSHIVVVMFPTPRFDLTYLRLFKLLASSRYNMLHSLSQSLAQVEGIPEIWRTTGRPCIPRIIFSFQIPWSSAKGMNEFSMRKLQQSLQEQVHLILKKNRLLGSLSSSSLFTVSSPNQLFVHVQTPQRSHVDPPTFFLNEMLKNSINMDMIYSTLFTKGSGHMSYVSQPSPTKMDDNSNRGDMSLRQFLYKQIDYMMTVESRDMPAEGRRGTHVEAPNIGLWYKVCEIVYEYFLGGSSDNNSHMKSLAQSLDLDWKFSENRCRKVTPLATNSYLDNLPSHYTQSVHLAQLGQCLRTFSANARGPAYEHFAAQLQEDCNQVWWNGRHLCEVTSLTGQPCVYPFHNIPHGMNEPPEEKTGIPSKQHSSRVTSIAACNCGRTQGTREDPFDLTAANHDFYQDLEKKCCMYLVHIRFPAFPSDDPLVKAKVAPTVQKKITILGRDSKTSLSDLSLVQTQTQTQPQSQSQQKSQPQNQNTTTDQAKEEVPSNQENQPINQSNVEPTNQESEKPDNEEGEIEEKEQDQNETTDETDTGKEEDQEIESEAAKQPSTDSPSVIQGAVATSTPGTIRLPPATAKELMKDSNKTTEDSTLNYSSVFQSTTDLTRGEEMMGYYSSVDGDRTRTQSLSVAPPQTDTKDNNFSESVDEQANVETMDYFEGMFTIDLMPGLLPLFNSWSLVVLGSAAMYNPQKGVEQAGFFTGSNYLLTWDIPVRVGDSPAAADFTVVETSDISSQEEQWPAPGEVVKTRSNSFSGQPGGHLPLYQTLSKVNSQALELLNSDKGKPQVGKVKRPGSKEVISIKAFIGHEYECPRGHRFFCSAPDKMIKASASGHLRENAVKLVTGDMPLYFPCPCRSSKPLHLAQLTRTYVVTPDSPCSVTLNPRIQPGDKEVTPTFYPGLKGGVTLPPNSYCVMRYPYVYLGENGPILPPAPNQPLLTCRLLKGIFSYAYPPTYDE